MFPPSHWKSCNKVHGNYFPFPFWNWTRLQQTHWVLMLKLYLLTFHTPRNVLIHILFNSWPKVLISSCSNGLLVSWVTRIRSLMDFIHNNSPQVCYIWNINSTFISKKSIFFQFISLIPILKTLLPQLVLYVHIQFIFNNMINNMLSQNLIGKY